MIRNKKVLLIACLVLLLLPVLVFAAAPSNNPSTVYSPKPIPPSITLTSPIGGESWERGTTHSITWTYKGAIGTSVNIQLFKAMTSVATLATSLPVGSNGVGSFSWTIDKNTAVAPDYHIVIKAEDANVKVYGNTFAIIAGAAEPATIKLTSPNGGEVWNKGFTYKITWTYTGKPNAPVKIMLVPKGDLASFIMISEDASVGSGGYGSFSWKVPFTVPRGADYTIWIGNGAVNKNFIDMSDSTFVINELVK